MQISTKYTKVQKSKSKKLSSLMYKFFKLQLNLFYGITYSPKYGLDKDSDVIISLTSFPDRITYVWLTIATLLSQSYKPRQVILWLSSVQFPNGERYLPLKLLKLKKYGLAIRFCSGDLRSHKKYYYVMQEYPECRIVTVDDDIFYPEDFLEKLVRLSDKYPKSVCCTWAHEIKHDETGIRPYGTWKYGVWGDLPSRNLIAIGCGGVLYPPHAVNAEVFNKKSIIELCLNADDIWLKCMECLNDTDTVRISETPLIYFNIMQTMKNGLNITNVGEKRNDFALQKILEVYPDIKGYFTEVE